MKPLHPPHQHTHNAYTYCSRSLADRSSQASQDRQTDSASASKSYLESFFSFRKEVVVSVVLMMLACIHLCNAQSLIQNITWDNSITNGRNYQFTTAQCCNGDYYIVRDSNTDDFNKWIYFSAPTGCKIKITYTKIYWKGQLRGINRQKKQGGGYNYDYLYYAEGTNSPGTTNYWYYSTDDNSTYTSDGNSLAIRFSNGCSNNSVFKIRVETTGCPTRTASISGCPSSMTVGQEVTLTGSVSAGGGTTTWSSSSIPAGAVTVTNGVVHANTAGTATVTYTRGAQGAYCEVSATCEITVTSGSGGSSCEEKTIGNAADYSHIQGPIATPYNYGYTQFIFTPTEIDCAKGGTISKIAFNYRSGTSITHNNFSIYLGETSKDAFTSNTDWIPVANLTKVYDGSFTFNTTGYQWIEFNQGTFAYSGQANLVVAVLNNDGTADGNMYFYLHYTANKQIFCYRNGSAISAATPPTADGIGTRRPDTRFCIECCTGTQPSFSLSGSTDMTVGSTTTLTPSLTGDITWYTSDGSVATVSDGVVTAIGTGTVTITAVLAASGDNCATKATKEITVSAGGGATNCDETDTIGTATYHNNYQYAPINNRFNYSYIQIIYTPDEVCGSGTSATIHRIGFQYYGSDNYTKDNISIYLSEADIDQFTTPLTWITSGITTPAFSGSVSATSDNWMWIELSSPYNYSGNSNLIVSVLNLSGTTSGNYFYFSSAPNNKYLLSEYCADNSSEKITDATNPEYAPGKRYSYRPNTKFCVECGGGSSDCDHEQRTIGTGTTNNTSNYGPVSNQHSYGYRQIIYDPSELECGGTISRIAFNYASSSATTRKNDVEIYMGVRANGTFSGTADWVTSGLTRVYTGSLNFATSGWTWFTLDTPFEYNGNDYLVVAILDNSGANDDYASYPYTYHYFYSSNTGSNKQIMYYGSISSITSPPDADYLQTYRPDTKFCIECCTKITSTFSLSSNSGSVAAGSTISVPLTNNTGQSVTWHSNDESVATVSDGTITGVVAGSTTITATVTGWTSGGTTYCDTTLTYTITVTAASSCEEILMSEIANKVIECGKTYCFYDDGGPTSNYNNGSNSWVTAIFTTSASSLKIRFEEFNIASGEYFQVYCAASGYDYIIATPSLSPVIDQEYECTSGVIRVRWRADGSSTASGWKAYITAEGCCTKITDPFSLSASSGSITMPATATVTLTNGTGQSVEWSTDNPSVATVSAATSGSSILATITGVGNGTTNIKAKVTGWTAGGTTYCDSTVIYTITVSDGCTQIGSSTTSTTEYSPIYGSKRYSYAQMLYTNAEVGNEACRITTLRFQYKDPSSITYTNRPVAIYMGHTTKTSFDNDRDFIDNSSLTAVYGTLNDLETWTLNAGWNTITLEHPFPYNGTSNIIVAVYYDYGALVPNGAATEFYRSLSDNRTVLCGFSGNVDPKTYVNNMGSYSGAGGEYSTAGTYRPNIKFCMDCTPCDLNATIEFGE